MANSPKNHERHPHPTLLSDFILGSQDGLVNVLGIVLGVSAATSNVWILFVAALAALFAESISMGAVAYTSTQARRNFYLNQVEQEREEMRNVPDTERQEVRDIVVGWGYRGSTAKKLTDIICSNPKAWLEVMMAFELHISPVEKSAPLRSFIIVLCSTVFGSSIPLIPFLFFQNSVSNGVIGAVVLSAIVLFIIGYYEAKQTVGSLWRSGLRMLVIGLAAGFAGYLIGHFLGAKAF
ncbi:MAG: VIT1/CCC1 transporter family protein [Candidatus Micrarchaeaceae archaeon]